ncbi:MAG TPA: proline racemase family protein, partial [Steroidobacteraceae bacterium]|nr:proline racemase family protein [Steroidobacteraceae bacterium]
VAWGGNWFFLCADHGLTLASGNIAALLDYSSRLRSALGAAGITGANDAAIDHVELFAPSTAAGIDSRNFVLCPGNAYDRSPCGTGTSAKLACLAADGKLAENEEWVQESIIGSAFRAGYQRSGAAAVVPTVRGSAYVNADATLLLDERDPFCFGIRG